MTEQLPSDQLSPPETCECCHYPSKFLTRFDGLHGYGASNAGKTHWYCGLCAGTEASSMSRYPNLYSAQSRNITQTVCYVGNAIIDAIRELKS